MGYTIIIGNATVRADMDARWAEMTVEGVSEEEAIEAGAPANTYGNRGNAICPSYLAWHGFAHRVGLDTTLYDGDHIVGGHPGVVPLTPQMVGAFEVAELQWMAEHPDADDRGKTLDELSDDEGDLRRLRWLCWWGRWALATCPYPSLGNS